MINFRKAFFITSTIASKDFLDDRPQVVFLGRSNVGKSSLINALCDNSKLMFVSKTPGRTTLLNYLDLDEEFYLVDAPGYGYASGEQGHFEQMMLDYFTKVKKVFAIILTDSRRPFMDSDLAMMELLSQFGVKSIAVLTKADKLNQKGRSEASKRVKSLFPEEEFIFASNKDKNSIEAVRKVISDELIKYRS